MQTSPVLLKRSLSRYPVAPVLKIYKKGNTHNNFSRIFWRNAMDPNFARASFWASDFRHKYLVKHGTDFNGKVPETPQSGLYQGYHDVRRILGGQHKPSRESRHLPITPLTARVVYEHDNEQRISVTRKFRTDRRRVEELKSHEFWGWYVKLQRVRGRWCKDQGISSRGVYGPAVDAAELWG